MEALEIKGKVNTAICYAKVVEDEAIEQIRRMCDYVMTEGSNNPAINPIIKQHHEAIRRYLQGVVTSLLCNGRAVAPT